MQKNKRKRIARKIKRLILKGFTLVMVVVLLLSISALDSDSWLPFVTTIISGGWLVLFAWANGLMDEYEGGEG